MYLIVGCGLSGAVIAENVARVLQKEVLIIDSRDHIGGNCFDYVDEKTGIRINKYGAHLFHTNSEKVWEYINRFHNWIRWEHTVLSYVDNQFVSVPVNITTVNKLCNQYIQNEEEMKEYIKSVQSSDIDIKNSEDMCISRVGKELYEKMFKEYTFKQWNKYPSELDPCVLSRIPIHTSFDTRYFKDKYQALPENGYTAFFKNLLDHPLINVKLNCDFFDLKDTDKFEKIIYTGPIDRYFKDLPKLEYRSIDFKIEHRLNTPYFQPNSVVNYPESNVPFTRIVEYKHFLNQQSDHSVIVYETTNDEGDPYYPVPTDRNKELYEQYRQLAEKESNVYFIGRLANYKYFNMDQAILNALEFFEDTELYN